MANKHFLKNCSTLLATRKMQIKSTSQNSIFKKISKQTTKTRNETSAVKGLGEKDGLIHPWCERKLVQRVWPTTEILVHLCSCCFYSQQSGNGTIPDIHQLTSGS